MKIIGVDIGGTNLRAGLVEDNRVITIESVKVNSAGAEKEIIDDLVILINKAGGEKVSGIGIGVPSLVDAEEGIVYDVTNIPSWKEVHLKKILEKELNLPVYINNDANCFVAGEKYFGEVKNFSSIAGLTLGTGLGCGLILNDKLYCGKNCGAGEFGMIPYKDKVLEYYCSGQFYINEYKITGEEALQLAEQGDEKALDIFNSFGRYIGEAIKLIIYSVDPEVFVLGGSVSKTYKYFEKSMWDSVNEFPFKNSLKNLKIMVSKLNHSAILGAAALYYENSQK